MLSNRPDHRSRLRAARLARRWSVIRQRKVRTREVYNEAAFHNWRSLAADAWLLYDKYINRLGETFADKEMALQRARRRLNLWVLEGRGKIRQGAR